MTADETEARRTWEEATWRHLPFFVLRGAVDGTLDPIDREIVDAHLEGCPTCRAEADDLRLFRAQIAEPAPARRRRPWLWWSLLAPVAGLAALVALRPAPRERVAEAPPTPAVPPLATPVARIAPSPAPKRVAAERKPPRRKPRPTPSQVADAQEGPLDGVPTTGRGAYRGAENSDDTPPLDVWLERGAPVLRWRAVDGADRYQIDYGPAGEKPGGEPRSVDAPQTRLRLPLTPGRSYDIEIVALEGDREIARSTLRKVRVGRGR